MEKREGGMDERRLASWIGRSIQIKGDVVSSGDLVIDGQLVGTIDLGNHSVTVGAGAAVTADLVGQIVTIGGSVKGNVTGLAKVELKATGSVEGDVTAPKLVMADGATLSGKVDTGSRR